MSFDFGLPKLPFDIHDGRYHVTSLIAEGGTARVFVCYDTSTRVWRALKLLLPEYALRADLRKRLITEATAMKRLDHPHITKVFEAFEDDANAYFVMEYAERGSVGDWVKENRPLPPAAAVEVTIQVCRAVAHAHNMGVVHRDIKPHNVLVDGRGLCTVADFGIAQVTWEDRLTRTGAALGTLGFIAPEQLDSAKHVDGRADIYSIGATLYMILVGTSPRDLFMYTADETLYDDIPEELTDIIVKATRYRRADRWRDVGAILSALEEAQKNLPGMDPNFQLLAAPQAPPIPQGLRSAAITPSRLGRPTENRLTRPPTFDVEDGQRTVRPGNKAKKK